MPSTLSILLSPLLALVSIPLLLSAYLTILFSLLALCIRLSVFYFELCYAIVANYFVIPTSSDSLLAFAPSEPATPRTLSPSTSPSTSTALSPSARRPIQTRPGARRYNSYTSPVSNSPPPNANASFSSLISGDHRRDFEDMGGWRNTTTPTATSYPTSYPTSYSESQLPHKTHHYHHLSSSTSTPSDLSIDDAADADERAWLSMNRRLELPSLGVHRRRSLGEGSGGGEALASYSAGTGSGTGTGTMTAAGKRHHRRSVTTSMLHGLPPMQVQSGGLTTNRPDIPVPSPGTGTGTGTATRRTSRSDLNDEYVVLRLPSGSSTPTPNTADSVESRDGLGIARFMPQY